MMRKLQVRVAENVAFELAEGRRNFEDYFETSYEAREVTDEEIIEMSDEVRSADAMMREISDEGASLRSLMELEQVLSNAACEAIQAAAMCRKWRESMVMGYVPINGKDESDD